MSTILVTGASGLIGSALSASLAETHDVIAMSRHRPPKELTWVRGAFHAFEDLRGLDDHRIDAVVHLGAVTGGCLEHEGMRVNVEGTRRLMRYLVDRGTKKFVMASSIAAVGLASPAFRPLQAPIPDDHPCLAVDGYGVSKHLMEEITRYMARQAPGIDVIDLRLCAVKDDDHAFPLYEGGDHVPYSAALITFMPLSDAVRAFTLAVESDHRPGVRVYNAAAPRAWVKRPMADILHQWYGDTVDLSHYKQAGHEWDSLFEVSKIRDELGFEAERGPAQFYPEAYPGA